MTDSDTDNSSNDVDIPEDISSVDDVTDIDGVEVEQEYWTDYTLQHHGIVFCWRNNLKQVLLAVEESIAGEEFSDNYDIVLLSADGEYIAQLDTAEDEETALKQALSFQQQYPQGEFPELDEQSEPASEFVPLTESSAEKKQERSENESTESSLESEEFDEFRDSRTGFFERLKNLFS